LQTRDGPPILVPMASKVRVVLADDHEVVRDGLRLLFEHAGDIEVVAEASDAAEARRRVAGHRPDVLVLDLNMPGEPVLGAIPTIVQGSPATRVVVLTMQGGTAYAKQALRSGVRGYVLKEAAGTELVEAVRTIAGGGTYITPALGARLAFEPDDGAEAPDGLTARELDVLRLLALGHTNAEIGDRLFLSRRTVETHRANVQTKTRTTGRAELVRYAFRHGLLNPEEDEP
jgi:two-component system, NarL family, response regulator NreC